MVTHVLIVHDDTLHTKLLTFLFTDQGYAVSTVARPAEVARAMQQQVADLILIEPRTRDGYAAVAQLRQQYPDLPILLIGQWAEPRDEIAALAAGADDFIAIPYEPAILLAHVEALLRRYRRADRAVVGALVQVGATSLDLGRLTFTTRSHTTLLTPTEMKMLECLMRKADMVVPRERLIAAVWGYESEAENNRLDVYMKRLRHKIESHPKDRDLLKTVRGVGYMYQGEHATAAVG